MTDELDRVVGDLVEFKTVRSNGTAHFEDLEPGKYALVRFEDTTEGRFDTEGGAMDLLNRAYPHLPQPLKEEYWGIREDEKHE